MRRKPDGYKALCRTVVKEILALAKKKSAAKGSFTIALSGGATPRGIYNLMAAAAYRKKFPWRKMHFFWGDERWVPPSHSENNSEGVRRLLFSKVPVPPENIHPIPTNLTSFRGAAARYEQQLREHFLKRKPAFDLVLLGLGRDGHIASIFPRSKALHEGKRWVVPVAADRGRSRRITLTLPVIRRAGAIFVIASGPEKAVILNKVLSPKKTGATLPVEKLMTAHRRIQFFFDKAAAAIRRDIK